LLPGLVNMDLRPSTCEAKETIMEKKFKQVCHCEHCGSESEMMITCTLEDASAAQSTAPAAAAPKTPGKTKGHAVCSHCGGEADIWLDL